MTFIQIALISFLFFWNSSVQAHYTKEELRSFENAEEKKIRDLNDQELHEIEITLKRRLPVHRRADLYFRLAELYFEFYRLEFLLEGKVHEKKITSGIVDKRIDRYHSKIYLNLGIEACLDILKFHIPFEKMANIYYLLGFYYAEKEDQKTSATYYLKLANEYPKHHLATIASKELGNYYFKTSDFHKSISYFKKALHSSEEKDLVSIKYKIAWCLYRMKNYQEAISEMQQVLEECFQKTELETLKEEAINDITLFLVEKESAKEAISYFKSIIKNSAYLTKILFKLASRYLEATKKSDAIFVYDFISQGNHENEVALLSLMEVEIERGNHHVVFEKIKQLNFHHSENEDLDNEASRIDDEEKKIKGLIRKTAVKHHSLYRKNKHKKDLQIAESYYDFYLSFFQKKIKDVLEVEMYLAEVKVFLEKKEEAIDIYRKISHQKEESPFVRKAQLLWLETLTDAIKKQKSSKVLSFLERDFVNLTDLWMRSAASKKLSDIQDLAIRSIRLLAGYPDTRKEALERIRQLLKRWPDSSYGITALQLWIQMYHEYPSDIESPSLEIAGNSSLLEFDHKKNQGKIKLWLDQEKRKKEVEAIDSYEKTGNTLQAAFSYEAFGKSEKDLNIREKAYKSALDGYLKNNRLDLGWKLIQNWSTKSSKKKEAIKTLASWSFVHGDDTISVELFYNLGTVYQEPESLETAARLYEGLGQLTKAQSLWSEYLQLYPKSSRYAQVALSLARSEEESLEDSRASQHYELCSRGEFTAECKSRLGDLYFKNKDFSKAKDFYEAAGKLKSSSFYVAYARFKLAEMQEKKFSLEPLTLPENHLQKVLSQRLQFLEILSREYQKVIQVGGPWGIGALHRLASFVMKCATELDAVEAPSHFTLENAKKFKSNLKNISDSLKKKAKGVWIDAYSKSIQNDVYSPFIPLIADALADFRGLPAESVPFRAQGPRNQLMLVGVSMQGDASGLEASLKKVRATIVSDKTQGAQGWIDYGNLLWGAKKPLLAKIAYEKALQIQPNHPGAFNNLAVLQIFMQGSEDWVAINEASYLLKKALHADNFFIEAKINLATLMNYYKNFSKAHNLWEQVLVKKNTQNVFEGLAISLQGLGKFNEAHIMFEKAKQANGVLAPFVIPYHQAAELSIQGSDGAKKCFSFLKDIDFSKINGFEKSSVEHLKERCEQWQNGF